MATINLLYKDEVKINDDIKIVIPKVGDIIKDEDSYYNLVSIITAMPIDLMVQLDDLGLDYTTINEYELFILTFNILKSEDTSLIFGELNLSDFDIATNQENGNIILQNIKTGTVIDRAIYERIANVLRQLHGLKKDRRKPANEEAKEYMLRRARDKMRRRHSRNEGSYLESLIISLVNTEQYKYNFEGTKELSIYQFNECVKQIIRKIDYDNRMHGVYAGTVNAKELSQDDLNWLVHK